MTNKPRNQRGHWQIKENVASVAAKYNAKVDFKNEYPGAYDSARRNGWIDEVCSHMVTPLPYNKKTFTYDECKNIAAKYNSRKGFEKGNGAAYRFSKQHGWLEEICSHMTRPITNVKWTFEKCKEEAAKYDTRVGFKSVCSGSAYNAARKNGWLEEICSHMVCGIEKNKKWTYDACKKEALLYNTRGEFRKNNKTAYATIHTNGWDELFEHFIEIKKPLGYWTYERCKEVALMFEYKKDLYTNYASAYDVILKNGWNELFEHFIEIKKPLGYWTKERCAEESIKYNTRVAFRQESPNAYSAAFRNGWLDEICSHMPSSRSSVSFGHWTEKENCKKEAAKYKYRRDFAKNSRGAYDSAFRNGWIDEICSHMPLLFEMNFPPGHWTEKENCKKEAAKYKYRHDFQQNSGGAYHSAFRNGWLDEICSHMEYRPSLIDVIYMWNTVENPDIWKIGVSNHYTVDKRIKNVLSQTEYTLHEVLWVQTENNARSVETRLLALGQSVELENAIDGKSEFRYLSEKDTQTAKKILETNGTVRYNITDTLRFNNEE